MNDGKNPPKSASAAQSGGGVAKRQPSGRVVHAVPRVASEPPRPAPELAGGAAREGMTTSAEERRRLQQAEMLLALSRKVAAIDSLDEIIETVMEMTSWELGAERATLFLNDAQTGELYSRFAQGNFRREIRFLNTQGIAGHVFQTGESLIVDDPYDNPHFNRQVDQQTGFTTRNIIAVPVKTVKGEIIGVAQCLNKKEGAFGEDDLRVLEAMTSQATVALQSSQFIERMKKNREKEMEFLDVVADVTSDIDLGSLLKKVMGEATRMLQADP
jgi:adenylate cyclase